MRITQNLNRRKCVIRWAPWLLLILLLFFFQADLLSRSKDYSNNRLSRALEVFGGKWEASRFGSSSENEDDADSEFDCETWLEKRDKIKYSRDFSTHPITVGYGETANWDTCAIGCKFQGSAAIDGEHKADAIFGLTNDHGIDSIIRSMESAQYYPDNDINNAKGKGFSVVMTTSLDSDVPVGYFSWAEYDIMAPPKNKTESALAAAFISNCGGHNFRLEAITKLRENGVAVDSYGACLRNKDGHAVNKLETLRNYKFSLAFENSNEDDYVTEKFWQSLVAGSIPVVIGAPNIYDFAPSNNSILYIKRAEDITSVAKQIKYLANNDAAYNAKLSWKYEGPSDSFKALVDMAVVHSSCRLCLHLGTKIRLKEEKQAKRPCQCKRNSPYTTYHIFVRERGKFEMESIYLRSNNLTLSALHDTILSKFTAMKYVPIFKSGRPKVILGDDTLKLYTIYPVGLTQRQALFKWRFRSDEDLQKYIEQHPCANFEVIFV